MIKLQVGDKAPDVRLEAAVNSERREVSLSDYKGGYVILFFYEHDRSPGCIRENCAFRDHFYLLRRAPDHGGEPAALIGIGPDTVESHLALAQKYRLPFPLLSDVKLKAAESYGCLSEKMCFGDRLPSIQRRTFLIDPEGIIVRIMQADDLRQHALQAADAWLEEAAEHADHYTSHHASQ